MKFNFRSISICCLLSIGLLTSKAQQSHQALLDTTRYLLYLPDGYEAGKATKWPLIVYLHGSGEMGTELDTLKAHSLPRFIEQGRKVPAIIISPQLAGRGPEGGWEIDILYHFIQNIKRAYPVDADRVYLTGASLGGIATWDLAVKYPEEFAAIVPVCGGRDTTDLWKLRYMPVWSFHGELDKNIPIAMDRNAVNALRKYNPGVRFSVYPNIAHNVWNVAYKLDSLYDWLLQQKRFSYKQVNLSAETMKQYTGAYMGAEKDTIHIKVSDGLIFINSDKTAWKPASADIFYQYPAIYNDIRFIRDKKGTIRSLEVMANKKYEYKRL